MLVTAWALNRKLSTYLKYYEMFVCDLFNLFLVLLFGQLTSEVEGEL